jgi:hypothetical protein
MRVLRAGGAKSRALGMRAGLSTLILVSTERCYPGTRGKACARVSLLQHRYSRALLSLVLMGTHRVHIRASLSSPCLPPSFSDSPAHLPLPLTRVRAHSCWSGTHGVLGVLTGTHQYAGHSQVLRGTHPFSGYSCTLPPVRSVRRSCSGTKAFSMSHRPVLTCTRQYSGRAHGYSAVLSGTHGYSRVLALVQ